MEKVKNLPIMRLAAFAVAVAIILGLSASMLSFTASAETVDDVVSQLGTLGNYGCFKYTAGQHVTFEFLRDIYQTSNAPYVVGVVFGYKDGKFVPISNTDTRILLGARSSSNSSLVMSFCSVNLYEADYPDKYDTMYQYFTVYNSGSMYGTTSFKSKNGVKDSSGFKSLADTYSDYVNQFGTTCYAVYTTSSTKWTDSQFVTFQNEIVSNLTDSDYKDIDTGASPSAEFVTCKSFTREDGGLPLWFKDFTADGLQYPMFTYYISDNGNKHRYQLRLSYSSSQSNVVNTIFGIVNENNLSEQEKTLRELGQFLKGNLPVGSSNYTKFMSLKPYMELILKKPEYISFDEAFSLNSNQMNFEASETSGNKVYTICLSDYSDIIANYIYRAQIVDMQTSEILDTTYFCSNKTYHKGDSGTGVKIYDYGDDSDKMLDDLINNTPSVTPGIDNKFSTTGDIIDMQDNDYLSGLKIDNIFSVLGQSAKSIGAFFQACLNIVPSAILSILLSTLSLLIVLRVLGR